MCLRVWCWRVADEGMPAAAGERSTLLSTRCGQIMSSFRSSGVRPLTHIAQAGRQMHACTSMHTHAHAASTHATHATLPVAWPLDSLTVVAPRSLHRQATPRVVDLEPGQVLFLPAYWWHHVVNPLPNDPVTLPSRFISSSSSSTTCSLPPLLSSHSPAAPGTGGDDPTVGVGLVVVSAGAVGIQRACPLQVGVSLPSAGNGGPPSRAPGGGS